MAFGPLWGPQSGTAGHKYRWVWNSQNAVQCGIKHYSPADVEACFTNRKVLVYGDSLNRNLMAFSFASLALYGGDLHSLVRISTTKTFGWQAAGKVQ